MTKIPIKRFLLCSILSIGLWSLTTGGQSNSLAEPTLAATSSAVPTTDATFNCFSVTRLSSPLSVVVDRPIAFQAFNEGRILGPQRVGSTNSGVYELQISIARKAFLEGWKLGEITTIELFVGDSLIIRDNCSFSPYKISGEETQTLDGMAIIMWVNPSPVNSMMRLRLIRESGNTYLFSWRYEVDDRLTQAQVETLMGSTLPQQAKFIRATIITQIDSLTNTSIRRELYAKFQSTDPDEAIYAFAALLRGQRQRDLTPFASNYEPVNIIPVTEGIPWWASENIAQRYVFPTEKDTCLLWVSRSFQNVYTIYVAIISK